MNYRISSLLTLLGLVGAGCSEPTEPTAVARVTVTPATITLASGATTTLAAETFDAKGSVLANRPINWSSSDLNWATVSAAGVVTSARNRGGSQANVTISASSEGQLGTAAIAINPEPVAQVRILPESIITIPGETQTLSLAIRDSSGASLSGRTSVWRSLNEDIATVSSTGQIRIQGYTGPEIRRTSIIVSVDTVTDSVSVTVLPLNESTLQLPDTIVINAGDEALLPVEIRSLNGTLLSNRAYNITITDTTIATPVGSNRLLARFYPEEVSKYSKLTATLNTLIDTARLIIKPARVQTIKVQIDSLVIQSIGPKPANQTCQDVCSAVQAIVHDAKGNQLQRAIYWSIQDTSIAQVVYTPRTSTAIRPSVFTGPNHRQTTLIARIDSVADTVPLIAVPIPVARTGIPRTMLLHPGGVRSVAPAEVTDSYGTVLPGRSTQYRLASGNSVSLTEAPRIQGASIGKSRIIATTANQIDTTDIEVNYWKDVSVGLQACALSRSGSIYCWGSSQLGMLGNNIDSLASSNWPTQIISDSLFSQISSAYASTCGLTISGSVLCWGRNDFGQAALPAGQNIARPSLAATGRTFTALSDGIGYHRCGIDAQGKVYCWGLSAHGQLGEGTIHAGLGCYLSCLTSYAVAEPRQIQSAETFLQVTTGAYFTCALTNTKRIFCWGNNSSGQLGDSTFSNRATPGPIKSDETFESVSASGSAVCALSTGGKIYCWGDSAGGYLGNGYVPNTTVSANERSQTVARPIQSTMLYKSASSSCGITLTGETFCWGPIPNGEVTTDVLAPTALVTGTPTQQQVALRFTQISRVGTPAMMCALSIDGEIACWGDNRYGQLGDGTQRSRGVWAIANRLNP